MLSLINDDSEQPRKNPTCDANFTLQCKKKSGTKTRKEAQERTEEKGDTDKVERGDSTKENYLEQFWPALK
uniref:Uncharacterized protein n=1 Tax=Amphimedon queenslandica TaxID=400682 RepID=A0A1X7UTG4_AMPQE